VRCEFIQGFQQIMRLNSVKTVQSAFTYVLLDITIKDLIKARSKNSTIKLEYTNSCELYLQIGIYKQLWILPANLNIQTVVNSTCKLEYTNSCEFYNQIWIYKQLWILPSNWKIQTVVNSTCKLEYKKSCEFYLQIGK